jgi:hypothetical protein
MPYGVIQVDTVKDSLNNVLAPASAVFRNRIINGAMVIDQRNAGASVTPTGANPYGIDRWSGILTQASKYSFQQNAGSVTPPTGYINYLGVTSLSAYAVLAGDTFALSQSIEGLNIADLAWGTANAKTVTLSFQVYSSLTGTFGGSLNNSAANRSYPFSYSVPTANTWTSISVTIAGDTTGTWLTTNGIGIQVRLGLGSGSTYSGTAGAWTASNIVQPTGSVSVVGTNGATFYITGVQLEVGTNATSFDYRDYGRELIMCQRYFYKTVSGLGASGLGEAFASGTYYNTAQISAFLNFPVTMRTAPTLYYTSVAGYYRFDSSNTSASFSALTTYYVAATGTMIYNATTTGTQGNGGIMSTTNASSYIGFTSEL